MTPASWMFDADGELMPPALDLFHDLNLTEDQWRDWWAVYDAESTARTRGRGGVRLQLLTGDPKQPRWVEVIDALIDLERIAPGDRETALKSEWIKFAGCPGCGSSGAFLRRDPKGVYEAGQVRLSCGRRCRTRDVLKELGIELLPELHELIGWVDEVNAKHAPSNVVDVNRKTADEAPVVRRARITWADQIEAEPVVWAWEEGGEGRIPSGSLSIAAGREGTGKSSFGIWMAAQISRGLLPGSYAGTPRKVFYVAVEDSWKYTLVPRLIAAGADMKMVGRFEVVNEVEDELTLSLPYDNSLLEREVKAHDVALVVIDPLMSVIGEKIDTHREREVRSALDPLAKLADRTGSVLLGVAHFNKGGGTDAASLITGSGAFKNVPRTVFGFARDESDENGGRVMSQVKNSLGRDDLPSLSYVIETAEVPTKKGVATTGKFSFTGTSDRSVADVLRDSRHDPEDMEERRDAATWIRGYLAENGGEAPAKSVIGAGKAVGYSEQTLKNARRKVADTARSGFGGDQVHTWILRAGTYAGTAGTEDQKPVPAVPQAVPPGHCKHGMKNGDQPDQFVGGRVSCPACALERREAS